MDYELSKVITWYEKRKDLFDTIKEIGDDMELENNDDKFNIEKTDTIDGLAYEQDTSSLILLLTDGMDWSDMNRHLLPVSYTHLTLPTIA